MPAKRTTSKSSSSITRSHPLSNAIWSECLIGASSIVRASFSTSSRSARSREGKLQVELAQLQYLATRLIRAWTHLERQKGGIGLRGPGETQLETDRRLIGERIKMLKSRLDKLRRQHHTQRRQRARSGTLSVSLVGYTNAGKSTLFNALTKAQAYAADQLFATLDTTSRRVYLGDEVGQIVVSDTVGFIRELPHQLVAAFRATLEETIHADLLLHVVDASSAVRLEQIEQVNDVLREIGADSIRQILVFNKIDAVPELAARGGAVERDEYGNISRVFLSAHGPGSGFAACRHRRDRYRGTSCRRRAARRRAGATTRRPPGFRTRALTAAADQVAPIW